MRCVIFGATGYLGTRLVPELLSAGHEVRVMARTPAKLDDVPWRGSVDVVEGDVTDADKVRQALAGQEVLYYLVHSMLVADFVNVDARGASIVADAAEQAGLSRIVYVGGIIPQEQELSAHLASRAEVGELLSKSGVPTVELRAAVIIGAGSASFEMLRYLTERLPLMVTPRWLRTRVQPIAVRDVLYYLTKAAELPADVSRAFDIGGPETFTYTEMSARYAAISGLRKRVAIPVPVLTPRLSSHWVNLITPLPRSLASSLMDSLENDVVCTEHDIAEHIPDPDGGLMHYEDAIEFALARLSEPQLHTRWFGLAADDCPAQPLPTDPDWAGGSLHEEVVERRVVEQVDRPHLLRLRAHASLPGRLWLELSVRDDGNGGSRYRQRALFQPHGFTGEAWWIASTPFRSAIFSGIARDITSRAHGAIAATRA
jgi:uncharacterized protein YbjT (DUF2867 family)